MAFLRIVRNHIDLSHFDETMAVINAERRSGVEARAPGLQYRFVAYDPSSGDGVISTVWDTREQAEAGLGISDELRARLDPLGYRNETLAVMEISHTFKAD